MHHGIIKRHRRFVCHAKRGPNYCGSNGSFSVKGRGKLHFPGRESAALCFLILCQVVTERFRCSLVPKGCGKLLALDEAHKFMDGLKSDGLSNTIVSAARMMRHDGLVPSKLCILDV